MILVANIEDIAWKLEEIAQAVNDSTRKLWLTKVPLLHLLEDADRDENFVRLQRRYIRPETPAWKIACKCRGRKLIPAFDSAMGKHWPFVLPDWAEKAMQKQQPVYLFDLIATTTAPIPEVWQQIRQIRDWFGANPPPTDYASVSLDCTTLKFKDAVKRVETWRDTGEAFNPKAEVLKCDRPPE